MASQNVELREIFLGLQRGMTSKLRANQKTITHPGTQGDATELCWLEMLKQYLPKRYQAEKAIVLDSKGQISDQIDIVIFDRQYSPFLLYQGNAIYVPAESVYAVIEVKPICNKKHMRYAGDKAASVRRLHRTNAPIYHAGGVILEPKEPFEIAAGLVTLESDWSTPFGDSFSKAFASLTGQNVLDFGCVLECGAFGVVASESEERSIEVSNDDIALISFFLGLLARLQQLGTVPAIEISEYAKSLHV